MAAEHGVATSAAPQVRGGVRPRMRAGLLLPWLAPLGTRAARLLWCGTLLLAGALLTAQPQPAAGQPAMVTVAATSAVAALPGERLAASVAWLLGEWYGPALAARTAPAGAAAAHAAPTASAAARLLLALTETERGLHLHSELVSSGRSLGVRNAWLPHGALGAVTATAAGDGYLLWSQAHRFPHLRSLAAPPRRSALLPAAGLTRLLGRPVTGRDVQAAAAYPGGVLVLLADGPVALGHGFDIVPDTAAWLAWREGPAAAGAPWRNLFPLHDGRVLLEPWSGDPVVTAADHVGAQPLAPDGLFSGTRAGVPPAGSLLAVAADGTAAWHAPGALIMRASGADAARSVRLPLGAAVPSASTAAGGGTVWMFDPRERRIRAFAATAADGLRQVLTVTPMLPAEELGGVQALAVTAGGQLLIGSQRAVWSIDRRGMPRWALRLLQTQPRQRLPQAFSLTAGGARGTFLLLDRSTGSVHRFSEQPEPAATPHLTSIEAPKPGAVAAAVTDSAMHAAERAWQRRQPESAALLLAAAGRQLKRWHAADPLADGIERRSTAIEQLSETVEHARYGEPPLTARIVPARYHPTLAAYYDTHPFALTIRNAARDRPTAEIALAVAGAASAITVSVPALAAGAETTLPVRLHAGGGAGRTGVAYHTTLWLSAAADSGAAPVLSALAFVVEPEHCLPEQAADTPGGAAHAAFLRWHLAAAAAAPALAAPSALSPYALIDRVARLADVAAGGRCLQTPNRTLAALSGSATDWALAVASVLHQRGTPVALLAAGAADSEGADALRADAAATPVLVLAWLESGDEAVDPAAPSVPSAAQQRIAAYLEEAAQPVPPGRVWALLPHAAAADGGGAAAWSAAGSAAASTAMATDAVHIVTVAAGQDARPPAAQAVLPVVGPDDLGDRNG